PVGEVSFYSPATTIQVGFGQAGDVPVVGQWLGDGTDHIGVFRPGTGTWYLDFANRAAGTSTAYSPATTLQISWGEPGAWPLAGAWLQGLPQLLDGAPGTGLGVADLLPGQVPALAAEAVRRWDAAGLRPDQLALLQGVQFVIADLPDGWLGEAVGR